MENERLSDNLDGNNFKNLKHDPSKGTGDNLLSSSGDPVLIFCNINIENINTHYFMPEHFHNFLDDSSCETFSAWHLIEEV